MSLYIIRHGQVCSNAERRFNGEVDENLDEKGIEQAVEAGKKLIGIKFSAIYCSPLKRTRQTLKALNLDPSIPVFYDDRLTERREGNLSGEPIDDDFLKNVYLNYYGKKIDGGCETIPEVFERVHSLIDEVKEKCKTENILFVTHGMIGRAVFFYFYPLPGDGNLFLYPESFLKNCEIRSFEFD